MVHREFVIDNLFYPEVIVLLLSWAEVQKSYKRGKNHSDIILLSGLDWQKLPSLCSLQLNCAPEDTF